MPLNIMELIMNDISKFKETEKSSEFIFDGKVLHLYRDEIYLPDGREASVKIHFALNVFATSKIS